MSKAKPKQQTQHKERGTWLTVWLVLIVLWSIGGTILLWDQRNPETTKMFQWALPTLFLLNVADIVAVVAIWFWKRWGLTLYLITTGLAIAVGLIVTRSQLIAFHYIIPLVILGYLVKPHQKNFE
jgi:hypothetical protein